MRWTGRPCFNPLHCGAVVASDAAGNAGARWSAVSIPFIAGQWSLHDLDAWEPPADARFQSPSLRGSGRFSRRCSARRRRRMAFQSPSLRGSGRFTFARLGGPGHPHVSIPFIAGQWSLRRRRGGGRAAPPRFQSPSLRGSGRFTPPAAWRRGKGEKVSIPFIAGQWSLRPRPIQSGSVGEDRFNPLHCGAVVASENHATKTSVGR